MFDLAGLQANVPLPLPLLLPLLLQHDPDRANGVIESADAATARCVSPAGCSAAPSPRPRRDERRQRFANLRVMQAAALREWAEARARG